MSLDAVAECFETWDLTRFQLFAQGESLPEEEFRPLLDAFETEIGFALPEEFREFCASPIGGLHIVAQEELWAAPKLLDFGPTWRHQNGLSVYGLASDTPDFLSLRAQRADFLQRFGDRVDLVPFMARTVPESVHCFERGGGIVEMSLVDADESRVHASFSELLMMEIQQLEDRLDRVVAESDATAGS